TSPGRRSTDARNVQNRHLHLDQRVAPASGVSSYTTACGEANGGGVAPLFLSRRRRERGTAPEEGVVEREGGRIALTDADAPCWRPSLSTARSAASGPPLPLRGKGSQTATAISSARVRTRQASGRSIRARTSRLLMWWPASSPSKRPRIGAPRT